MKKNRTFGIKMSKRGAIGDLKDGEEADEDMGQGIKLASKAVIEKRKIKPRKRPNQGAAGASSRNSFAALVSRSHLF